MPNNQNLALNLKVHELSAPGKTFLLGEYYVTQRGEAYVITTEPRFRLQCEPAVFSLINIHPDSPAGKLIRDHINLFSHNKLTFIDPYKELGGFGASTAQFLLTYQLLQQKQHPQFMNPSLISLINYYLKYAWSGQGTMPSGADLLAQTIGGICYVNKLTLEVTKLQWPFPNFEFHIVHTNNKLTTHTHLANLENLNTSMLENIFKDAKKAFELSNCAHFCEAINQYQHELKKLGLVADTTFKLIKNFNTQPEIVAAKGCGAMGADTLLLITKKNKTALIKNLCKQFNLTYIANNQTSNIY